jgi:hypothetical protein
MLHQRVITNTTLQQHQIYAPCHLDTSSAVQIISKRALQLSSTFANHRRQILNVIASCDAELAHKVFRCVLQVPIVQRRVDLIFRSTKVRVRADRSRAFEALQAILGSALLGRVESVATEELVGGDAFLRAELLTGVLL